MTTSSRARLPVTAGHRLAPFAGARRGWRVFVVGRSLWVARERGFGCRDFCCNCSCVEL